MEFKVLRDEHKKLLLELQKKQNDFQEAFIQQKLFFETKEILQEIRSINEKIKLVENLLVLIYKSHDTAA